MRLLLPIIFLIFINIVPALAIDIAEFDVTEEEGVYDIKASVILYAPADNVRNVLTDYVHIYRLNPSIVESEVLASPGNNVTRVRTKVIGCVAYQCEELDRVEDVRILASGDIQAKIVPGYGQFKSGITLWQIQSMGKNSKLTYRAKMEPNFFIPPIIGSNLVKAKLREEIKTSLIRLEKIASVLSE